MVVVFLYFGYVVRIQSHFSNILTELCRPYSKLLTRSLEGALTIIRSYCNLEAGDTSEMDLAKQGLEP